MWIWEQKTSPILYKLGNTMWNYMRPQCFSQFWRIGLTREGPQSDCNMDPYLFTIAFWIAVVTNLNNNYFPKTNLICLIYVWLSTKFRFIYIIYSFDHFLGWFFLEPRIVNCDSKHLFHQRSSIIQIMPRQEQT